MDEYESMGRTRDADEGGGGGWDRGRGDRGHDWSGLELEGAGTNGGKDEVGMGRTNGAVIG
jgi:hypothetical protein